MKTEVNPKDTARAETFEMWMTSPMPMVALDLIRRLLSYRFDVLQIDNEFDS